MVKKSRFTLTELEQLLGIDRRPANTKSVLRREIRNYLETFREARIGKAWALLPQEEEVACNVFMALANPSQKLLSELQRTEEDSRYWSGQVKPAARIKSQSNDDEDRVEEDEDEEDYRYDEDRAILRILDSWRGSEELRPLTRGRRPAEVLFGFHCDFDNMADTWTTDLRFLPFNNNWICGIAWRGAWNDYSENTSLPTILGFANRQALYRSIMLLASESHLDWWSSMEGQGETTIVGKRLPPAPYKDAIEICLPQLRVCRDIDHGDEISNPWGDILPRLTDKELRDVVPKIDTWSLAESQADWMRAHGVDVDEVGYGDSDALLATFSTKIDRTISYRSVVPRRKRTPVAQPHVTTTVDQTEAPPELKGR
jgi:hypothetical protein